MLTELQLRSYLARLAYQGPLAPDISTLFALHEAHLTNIPFENLDIALGNKITLSSEAVLAKMVERSRGGFCYELNYAFYLLLRKLGFDAVLVSAKVWNGNDFGLDFDHMLLLVTVQNTAYAADVGFGECFRTPLALDDGAEVEAINIRYKLTPAGANRWLLRQSKGAEEWANEYSFSVEPCVIDDFHAMCDYQQTSPNSHFTSKSICSIATPTGRQTLSNNKWITTHHLTRTERAINSELEYRDVLRSVFRVALPHDAALSALMRV
jgi:N-hydroxyarylamine O-acetyltransferase